MSTPEIPDYFATCQLPSQQFESHLVTTVIGIEPITTTHPFYPEFKNLPKSRMLYFSILTQSTPAFPLGGGQAGDHGTIIVNGGDDGDASGDAGKKKQRFPILGTYRVSNNIHHVISVPKESNIDTILIPNQTQVTIIVDMQRRLFLMHNHTCQHLLSAIFAQVFQFDTFGWTSGSYSSSTPIITTPPFNPSLWSQIQETLSTIDFTGDFNETMKTFSFNKLTAFLIKSAGPTYPFHLFMTKLFGIISIWIPQEDLRAQYRQLVLEIFNFETLLKTNLDTLLTTFNPSSFTFEHIAQTVEAIANFVMTMDHQIEVHIEGVIEEPTAPPEQSTTSMGSTTSTTESDGSVIRQNVSKYSKYAKGGAVPKRFVSIGIEKSPCCGTHVSNLREIQSVTILAAYRHGGRWRISFTPQISALAPQHWTYQLTDLLKSKFSCQFDEIAPSIDKTITTANSLKNYKSKIYGLVGGMLFDEYMKQCKLAKDNNNIEQNDAKIIIHYNDPFLTSTEDLTNACYALSEACNAVGITARPILVMTNADSTDLSIPGVFLIYGTTETQAAVKALGNVFVSTLNCKGGGRPGVYQGKIPAWDNFQQTKDQLSNNDQGYSYVALSGSK